LYPVFVDSLAATAGAVATISPFITPFPSSSRYNFAQMDFLKTVTGKVVSGLVGLVVILTAISWYRMDESTKHMLISGTGHIISWLGIVLVVPWLAFALIGWVSRMDSNAAGAVLVAVITILETLLLAWLFNWSVSGTAAWTFLILGGLVAGLYNLLTCDWIAEKVVG
jgi:hypothetical protein